MSQANRIAFQTFLQDKGANFRQYGIDGQVGGVTLGEFYRLFTNRNAAPVTDDQIAGWARGLGASPKQLKAFAAVESGGGGFQPTGHPKILWERHYFWRRIRITLPLISNPRPGGYTLDSNRNGINDSWEKLQMACRRDPVAAFESCSWGKFQIMGAHWKALGYESVFHFAWSMVESEAGHYEGFVRFIRVNKLARLLARVSTNPADNIPIVRRYNGPGFRKFAYHEKLAREMRS